MRRLSQGHPVTLWQSWDFLMIILRHHVLWLLITSPAGTKLLENKFIPMLDPSTLENPISKYQQTHAQFPGSLRVPAP